MKGTKSNAFSEAIRSYGSAEYNYRHFPHSTTDYNDYGPYNPKAVGFSYRLGGGLGIPGGGLELGMAFGSGEIAFFASPTVTAGINYPSLGGISFNMYDTYGGQQNVYDGMVGQSAGMEVNAVFGGGYSKSSYVSNNQVYFLDKGTSTTSISFPTLTNWGISATNSNTKILWRPLKK